MARIEIINGAEVEMSPEREATFLEQIANAPAFDLVPQKASKLGLKRALDEIGRWQEVKGLIGADPLIAEEWDLAIEISRTDPIFAGFVASRAFSDPEIDAVFRRAVEVVA